MKNLHIHSVSKITPYIQNLPKKVLTAEVGMVDAGNQNSREALCQPF
jgi:hypothetical protein